MSTLLKNGLIIDGTGKNRYQADIYIEGDTIKEIGTDLGKKEAKTIDAKGKIIAPGFIDMHHHGDLLILKINKAEATVMQGVTTLAVGMCGIGLAPANEKVRNYYENYVTKIFGSDEMKLYDNLQDYFDEIEKKGISPNLAFFIPQGNVRASVLGTEERSANAHELEEMKRIVKEGMEQGAFGLTTGLIYPPGSITETEEIIELCKVVSQYDGLYDSHMRNEATSVLDVGMGELIEIIEKANVRGQISHWKAGSNFAWSLTPEMIQLVKDARSRGLDIHADMYPYEEGSTSLSGVLLRPWVYDDFKKNLSQSDTRQRIIDETLDMFFSTFLKDLPWYIRIIPRGIMKRLIYWFVKMKVRIISVIHNHQIEGNFLGEALKVLYPEDNFENALLNFIRDEEGAIMVSFKQMSEEKSILELIKQDFVCIGSDGFLVEDSNTHPRSYGAFAKILGDYARKKKLFSLEEAVRKMTGLSASILKLPDRGLIKEGYKADIVIFNEEKIIDTSTYADGRQYPEGIDYVFINGELTVEKGKHMGNLSGRILKFQK